MATRAILWLTVWCVGGCSSEAYYLIRKATYERARALSPERRSQTAVSAIEDRDARLTRVKLHALRLDDAATTPVASGELEGVLVRARAINSAVSAAAAVLGVGTGLLAIGISTLATATSGSSSIAGDSVLTAIGTVHVLVGAIVWGVMEGSRRPLEVAVSDPSYRILDDEPDLQATRSAATCKLDPEWEIVRPDRQSWSLECGAGSSVVQIVARPGSLAGPTTNDARNLFLRPAVAGDFSLRARVRFAPSQEGEEAGLVIYQDDDDYVKVVRRFAAGRVEYAAGEETRGHLEEARLAAGGARTYLRLDRVGTAYYAYATNGKSVWKLIGSFSIALASPRIGYLVVAGPGAIDDGPGPHGSAADIRAQGAPAAFSSFQLQTFVIQTHSAPDGQVGQPYELLPRATGSSGNVTWSLAGGTLPLGVALDPMSGAVKGVPSATGDYNLILSAADGVGTRSTTDLKIHVDAGD